MTITSISSNNLFIIIIIIKYKHNLLALFFLCL